MNPDTISKRQRNLWLTGALLVPAAHSASRCSWLTVLAVGSAVGILNWLLPRYRKEPGKVLAFMQGIWNAVVIALLLQWNAGCWPSHESPYGASLILLALAVWTVWGGSQKTAGIGCVLIWPVAALLAGVLLSGAPEVAAERIGPQWSMPDAALVVILLIPLLERKQSLPMIAGGTVLAAAAALITSGVLGISAARTTMVPIYELSRSIRVLGIGERLESLTAVAMTLGYYMAVCYLLNASVRTAGDKHTVWGFALVSTALYLMNGIMDTRIIAVGSILLWVVLPVLGSIKKICKKR